MLSPRSRFVSIEISIRALNFLLPAFKAISYKISDKIIKLIYN